MSPLSLTILGASPAAPNVGGACSGYLVRQGETAVLLDCGSGVAGRIGQHLSARQLDGVCISHLHPDHYFDLVPLYYILKFRERRPPLPLYVPPDGRAFFRRFGEVIAQDEAMLDDIFQVCEYSPAGPLGIGSLKLSFHPVQHYVPSHAIRVEATDGGVLVFSSDVGPCEALIDAARGADLLLCESALVDAANDEPQPHHRGHMSAAEAGAAARAAGVRRLVLTHYRGGDDYDQHHLQTAQAAFGEHVALAREGETYTITR